jgi:hypothetical protein
MKKIKKKRGKKRRKTKKRGNEWELNMIEMGRK